jgi:hypothetical protein
MKKENKPKFVKPVSKVVASIFTTTCMHSSGGLVNPRKQNKS